MRISEFIFDLILLDYMEAADPKRVNPIILNIIGVNSPRLGGLQMYKNEKYPLTVIYFSRISFD